MKTRCPHCGKLFVIEVNAQELDEDDEEEEEED